MALQAVAPAKAESMVPVDVVETFNRLLNEEAGAMFRLAKRLMGEDEQAKDLVQEALLRAFQSLEAFRGESSLKNWVFKILVNQGIKKIRRRTLFSSIKSLFKQQAQTSGPQSIEWVTTNPISPEKMTELKEKAKLLQGLLLYLSAKQRTVFVLRYLQGMSVVEIADIMQAKTGTVKTHLVRALKQIRISSKLMEVENDKL